MEIYLSHTGRDGKFLWRVWGEKNMSKVAGNSTYRMKSKRRHWRDQKRQNK
jgi:hypothetical protein